jgi:hypothetical protein
LPGWPQAPNARALCPPPEQVYGFKIAPVLGGETGLSNVEVIDFVVGLNVLGQLHRQIRDLPPGTRISGFTIDGKAP